VTKKPVVPTHVNDMGEKAFKLDPREELVSTVLTTFLSDSYYEKEEAVTKRILDACNQCDPLFVAKLAIYARTQANMRSVSHLLAGWLSMELSGREGIGRRFYSKIVNRPDDMSEILAYIKHRDTVVRKQKKFRIPNHIKKGFKAYLEGLNPYRIDKYKMKTKELSLVDLVNLLHPKPNKSNEEAYRRLMAGESLDGLYTGDILQKSMSQAGQEAKKEGVSEEQADELKGEALSAVINSPQGMPIMNLIRNLRNIINYADEKTFVEAMLQLVTPNKILNSKQLPFRFLSAYKAVEAMKPSPISRPKSKVAFEKEEGISQGEVNNRINLTLRSLEAALALSIANIPKLQGSTAILIDHSGSMGGDSGGKSLVSAMSSVTTCMIADTFAAMMAKSQDNIYIGLFGDRLINVPASEARSREALDLANHINKEGSRCGAATEAGIYEFLRTCVKDKVRVDNLIIFSDMVIGEGGTSSWYGHTDRGNFHIVFKEFKKINPQCKTISVDLKQTKGTSVFDKSMNVTQVAGWSDKIFDLVASAGRGYKDLINEIEKIVI
jgi:hypothetical protein